MDTTDTKERQNPYELVFGVESIDDRLFPPIAEEAEARDQPLDDPDRFLFLSSVGKLLQAIAEPDAYQDRHVAEGRADDRPPVAGLEGGSGGEASPMDLDEPPERAAGPAPGPDAGEPDTASDPEGRDDALRQYGRLLYHAFHYWQARKPTRRVDEAGVRWLLDDVSSVGEWMLTPPARSGYLQLPQNLIWAEPAPGLTPEPVDGFFWHFTEPERLAPHLHVLLALGVRGDRPGFSVVPATGVLDDERHWAELDARPGGTDFETNLPGGEMDELYSIETAAEVLKLVSLCFWKLDPSTG
jgi:hypothetical protein